MHTVLEILNKSSDFLYERGIDQARHQAEEVISDVLQIKRIDLYLQYDRPLHEPEIEKCREALSRRAQGEPPQLIRGFVDFMDCSIKVNSSVLIPRPETEILGEMISDQLSEEAFEDKILWDVCTGSGCLGIGLKKRYPELYVTISDISSESLEVAKENICTNVVRIACLQGDLLQPFEGEKADYLVCNPPYIKEEDYNSLPIEVRLYEPKRALIGGESGFEYYERLARDLPTVLNPGGKVWLEIGFDQGESVKTLFSDPCWKRSEIKKDWSGHDRFFLLEIE